jgi:hypothetical protein
MCVGTHYIEFVFLHPIRSTGHIVPFGASGPERSIYFSHALGGPQRIPQKSCRELYTELMLLHPLGSMSHVVRSGLSEVRNINTVFSCSDGTSSDPTKKRTGIRYAELVFLHPVGSLGHVVCSVVPGAQIIDAVFFMLRWARCGSHEMRTGTHYTELVFFIWWHLRIT